MIKDLIKTVIIDDVESIRAVLKKLLSNYENILIKGEAADVDSAIELIREEKPDLLFLDIDLNGLISLDILKSIDYEPMVVFITSHTSFAVKAFELNAVDYMLKPISSERLTKAIEKVRNKWHKLDAASDKDDEESVFEPDHMVLLNFDDKFSFVRVNEITHVEAYGNYTKIYVNDGRMSIAYNSLKNWITRLPTDLFIQIHRSTLINMSYVNKIEKWSNDTGRIFLKDHVQPLEISRSYFFELKKRYKM